MFNRILLGLILFSVSTVTFGKGLKECSDTSPINSEIKNVTAILDKVQTCPNNEKLADLCLAVYSKSEDEDPEGPYSYEYQRIVLEASCADPEKDSEAEVTRKVNQLWNKFENELTCDDSTFSVRKGSIIKYAAANRFTSLIEDATQVWRVNLNRVDAADGLTVLDYVKKQLDTYKDKSNQRILQGYYDALKKAGAKHKSEL